MSIFNSTFVIALLGRIEMKNKTIQNLCGIIVGVVASILFAVEY